jgi:hypothetical protein
MQSKIFSRHISLKPFKDATWFHKRFIEVFDHPSEGLEGGYPYGEVLQEVSYNQEMEMVDSLVRSMPKRCRLVIEAEGGWQKY